MIYNNEEYNSIPTEFMFLNEINEIGHENQMMLFCACYQGHKKSGSQIEPQYIEVYYWMKISEFHKASTGSRFSEALFSSTLFSIFFVMTLEL